MDKFFSNFGKAVLIILFIGAIVYGGYYLGKNSNKNFPTVNVSVTPTPEFFLNPTTTSTPLKTVQGGIDKSAGLSFYKYTLKVPTDWSAKQESQQLAQTLTLTKGEYIIKIFQAATGGALCLYPDDPEFEGPSSRFSKFTPLTTQDDLILRRSSTEQVNQDDEIGFTICQQTTEGDFNQPTVYGHISITIPQSYDQQVLDEIDTIITTLKKM